MKYYELPYEYDIGQAVQLNFPRPIYPPDNTSGPSANGPDIVAYKRIAWHLGRWATAQGVPQESPQFDDAYNLGFAHGTGSGVGSSGIEGIQRQAKVAGANGVVGQRTFNILIYSRIPEGLPNAGKLITSIDNKVVDLLQDAWQNFGEEDTDETPPPVSSPRKVALAHLEKRVGYTENPPGSNFDSRPDGIHAAQDATAGGAHWLDRTFWCGEWCFYALQNAGVEGLGSWMASVALIEDYARLGQKCFKGWTRDKSKVLPGDLVVVGGRGVHVETARAKALSDGSVPTYGGNTSAGIAGSQSNGGGAFRRVRSSSEIYGFALVRYPGE